MCIRDSYIYNIVFFKCRAQLFGSVHCSGHTGILARGLVENAADVIQGMLPYLNNAQTERLQEVLQHTLF